METKLLAGDATQDSDDSYNVVASLGRGNFADVYQIRTSDGATYALKYHRRAFRGHRDRSSAIREVQVMLQLKNHPNVLQLHRAWQCDGHFLLQTELCCRATCRDLLDRYNHGLPIEVVAKIGHDVANGLSGIHAAGFVHNDIKPSNILFREADCKIGDFGMAVSMSTEDCFVEGDQRYMAPEVLSDSAFRAAADIFSLGLTLYEASTGAFIPSGGPRWHDLRKGNVAGPTGAPTSELICKRMMHPAPTERPTAASIVDQLRQPPGRNLFLHNFVAEEEPIQRPPPQQQQQLHSPPVY